MTVRAFCIQCGGEKAAPWQRCRVCGFDPTVDEMSLAKSVYLSSGRYDTAEQAREHDGELDELARRIRSGDQIDYDPDDLERLAKQRQMVESIPARAVWGAVVRFFLPGVALIVGLLLLYVFLRWLNSS